MILQQGKSRSVARLALQNRAYLADRLITQARIHQQRGQMHPQRHVIGHGPDRLAQAIEHRRVSFHTVIH